MAGIPLTHLGRRGTLILTSFLFLAGYVALGSSSLHEIVYVILASRGLIGFAVGMAMPAAQIYVSECSESAYRGLLSSLPALSMALGIVVTYAFGSFLPWDDLAYFCSAFSVLLFSAMITMPRSPMWLISRGRQDEAREALIRLRAPGKKVESEMAVMVDTLTTGPKPDNSDNGNKDESPRGSLSKDLLSRPVLRPFLVVMSLQAFQQWSGVNAVIFCLKTIFREAESNAIDENLATVLVGIVQFVATFGSMFVVDLFGRRPLLLASALIMSASTAAVGAFFAIDPEKRADIPGLEWLPMVGLVLFMVGYSVGFATVPFVLLGEMLPSKFRNALGPVATAWNLANTFLVIKLFATLGNLIGYHGVFFLYAAVSAASYVFVLCFVPETKGKTLAEIEALFAAKNAKVEHTV